MPTEITPAKFMEYYEKGLIYDPISVTINGEQRIYARAVATMDQEKQVVYAVLS